MYSPMHRFLWCVGIGWILIATSTDNAGMQKFSSEYHDSHIQMYKSISRFTEENMFSLIAGPITNFLRNRVFVVLSRLTYSAYLLNGLVELHSAATLRTPQYLSNFQLVSMIKFKT